MVRIEKSNISLWESFHILETDYKEKILGRRYVVSILLHGLMTCPSSLVQYEEKNESVKSSSAECDGDLGENCKTDYSSENVGIQGNSVASAMPSALYIFNGQITERGYQAICNYLTLLSSEEVWEYFCQYVIGMVKREDLLERRLAKIYVTEDDKNDMLELYSYAALNRFLRCCMGHQKLLDMLVEHLRLVTQRDRDGNCVHNVGASDWYCFYILSNYIPYNLPLIIVPSVTSEPQLVAMVGGQDMVFSENNSCELQGLLRVSRGASDADIEAEVIEGASAPTAEGYIKLVTDPKLQEPIDAEVVRMDSPNNAKDGGTDGVVCCCKLPGELCLSELEVTRRCISSLAESTSLSQFKCCIFCECFFRDMCALVLPVATKEIARLLENASSKLPWHKNRHIRKHLYHILMYVRDAVGYCVDTNDATDSRSRFSGASRNGLRKYYETLYNAKPRADVSNNRVFPIECLLTLCSPLEEAAACADIRNQVCALSKMLQDLMVILIELLEYLETCFYHHTIEKDNAVEGVEVDSIVFADGTSAIGQSKRLGAGEDFESECELDVVRVGVDGLGDRNMWYVDMMRLTSDSLLPYIRKIHKISTSNLCTPMTGTGACDSEATEPTALPCLDYKIESIISLSDVIELLQCSVASHRQILALECLKCYFLVPNLDPFLDVSITRSSFTATSCEGRAQSAPKVESESEMLVSSNINSKSSSASGGTRNALPKKLGGRQLPPSGKKISASSAASVKDVSGAGPRSSIKMKRSGSLKPKPDRKGSLSAPPTTSGPLVDNESNKYTEILTLNNAVYNTSVNALDEICKCGAIRHLCWFLVHSQCEARQAAANILDNCVEIGCKSRPIARDSLENSPLAQSSSYSLAMTSSTDSVNALHRSSSTGTLNLKDKLKSREGNVMSTEISNYADAVLYVNIMEQGLVSLLRVVASGRGSGAQSNTNSEYFYADAQLLFPEQSIRQCALRLLAKCDQFIVSNAQNIGTYTGLAAAQTPNSHSMIVRLSNALIYSGNNRLKINICSGFLCLWRNRSREGGSVRQAQAEMLSRERHIKTDEIFADSSTELTLFYNLLCQYCGHVQGNPSGCTAFLYAFVSMILHLLKEQWATMGVEGLSNIGHPRGSKSEGICKREGAEFDLEASGIATLPAATVLVRPNPGDFNRASGLPRAQSGRTPASDMELLKMQCPTYAVLYVQCRVLFDALMNHTPLRLPLNTDAMSPQPDYLLSSNLISFPSNPNEHLTLTYGQHSVWQEVFSHITDTYLLEMGAKRLTLKYLLQCYEIAFHYRMYVLMDAYADIFVKRYLNVESEQYEDGNLVLVSDV